MFDLEQAILEWRRQMLAAGIRLAGRLDELENHLREDIARLQQSGADLSEAFDLAERHLGDRAVLGKEFRKNDRFAAPVIFALLSLALFVGALFLPLVFGVAYVCVVSASVWEMSGIATVGGVVLFAVMLGLPFVRPRAWVWKVPFIFGVTMLLCAVMAAVYTFMFADRLIIDFYFDPRTLAVLAIAAALGVVEGRLLKSGVHPVATVSERYV